MILTNDYKLEFPGSFSKLLKPFFFFNAQGNLQKFLFNWNLASDFLFSSQCNSRGLDSELIIQNAHTANRLQVKITVVRRNKCKVALQTDTGGFFFFFESVLSILIKIFLLSLQFYILEELRVSSISNSSERKPPAFLAVRFSHIY